MTIRTCFSFVAVALAISSPAVAQGPGDQKVPPPTSATPKQGAGPTDIPPLVEEFLKRVNGYIHVQQLAAKKTPPLKSSDDPAKIEVAQMALATKIGEMRAGAKQGDIFTPEIAGVFRRILAPELNGKEGADTKASLKDDAPAVAPLKVNSQVSVGCDAPHIACGGSRKPADAAERNGIPDHQ